MAEHFCPSHKFREATIQCTGCGDWFCGECVYRFEDAAFCHRQKCVTQYLQLKNPPAPASKRLPLRSANSTILKTGIGFLFFSAINFLLSFMDSSSAILDTVQKTIAPVADYMPHADQFTSGFVVFFQQLKLVRSLEVYFSLAGIAVSLLMILQIRNIRRAFVGYLLLYIAFQIYASYTIYQAQKQFSQLISQFAGNLPLPPISGALTLMPMLSGVVGIGISVWLLIKFLRKTD